MSLEAGRPGSRLLESLAKERRWGLSPGSYIKGESEVMEHTGEHPSPPSQSPIDLVLSEGLPDGQAGGVFGSPGSGIRQASV